MEMIDKELSEVKARMSEENFKKCEELADKIYSTLMSLQKYTDMSEEEYKRVLINTIKQIIQK